MINLRLFCALVILTAVFLSSCKCPVENSTANINEFHFNLKTLQSDSNNIYRPDKSYLIDKEVMIFDPVEDKNAIILYSGNEQIKWEDYNYLVYEVYHENQSSVILYSNFYKGKNPPLI